MQIDLTIKDLKNIIKVASCDLDDSLSLKNISSLENARPEDLAVIIDRGDKSVFSQINIDKIKNSKARAFLASKKLVDDKDFIIVDNSLDAFSNIINFVEKKDLNNKNYIIGQNNIIYPDVYIGKNVIIGDNCKIYPGVKILDNCIIGNNCIIHAGAIIGSDGFGYSVSQYGLQKIPQIGIVKIGSFVEIGANSTIDRAAFDQTYIGNGVKIDNLVHIAHNVIIKDHTVILAQTGIAGGVEIGVGCQIGGQVAIKDHVKIGDGAKIVSKSAIMKDVEPNKVVCGIPAVDFTHWKKTSVVINKLPEYFGTFNKVKDFIEKRENKKSFWQKLFK